MRKAKINLIISSIVIFVLIFFSQIFLIFKISRDLTFAYFKEESKSELKTYISIEEIKNSIERIKSLSDY
ncbi:MAG: hypothetical protein QW367_03080 [Candidatus Aenigmatarchaeota archaeon]